MLLGSQLKIKSEQARLFIISKLSKLSAKANYTAVAGSLGKSITAVACKSVLEEKFSTFSSTDVQSPFGGSYFDNLTSTMIRKRGAEQVVIELGINENEGMERMLSRFEPSTVVIEKLSLSNTSGLITQERMIQEQLILVKSLGEEDTLILNYDDPQVRKLADETAAGVIFIGSDSKNCHIWIGNFKIENFGNCFELNYGVERIKVESKLLGYHQVYPLLAAAALGLNFGIALTNVKKGLERVESLDHRMQALNGFGNSVVIDDSYNASPSSLTDALDTLNQTSARRRIAVLGEMKNLGEFADREHRKIAAKIYKDKVDLVLLSAREAGIIGDELIKLGFIPDRLFTGLNNAQIVNRLLKVVAKGDVVLVAGSHSQRFDEVVKRISRSTSR